MKAWLYIFDTFYPVELDIPSFLEVFNENPGGTFEFIRSKVAEELGTPFFEVRLHATLVSKYGYLVEWIVCWGYNSVSVKLIIGDNPFKVLEIYHECERWF